MCITVDNVFTCGHRSFQRLLWCKQLGFTCFGPQSRYNKEEKVDRICSHCEWREHLQANHPEYYKADGWGKDDPYKDPERRGRI